MAKPFEALAVILSAITLGLVVYALYPNTPLYAFITQDMPIPIVTTFRRVWMNGPIELKELYRIPLYSLISSAVLLIIILPILLVGIMKRNSPGTAEMHRRSLTLSKWGSLVVCLALSAAVLAFLFVPNALFTTSYCSSARLPNHQQIGPCFQFRGSASFGKWGPESGWTAAVIGLMCSILATTAVWAIQRSYPIFPFVEF